MINNLFRRTFIADQIFVPQSLLLGWARVRCDGDCGANHCGALGCYGDGFLGNLSHWSTAAYWFLESDKIFIAIFIARPMFLFTYIGGCNFGIG